MTNARTKNNVTTKAFAVLRIIGAIGALNATDLDIIPELMSLDDGGLIAPSPKGWRLTKAGRRALEKPSHVDDVRAGGLS